MSQLKFSAVMSKVGLGLKKLRLAKGYDNLRQFTTDHHLPMIQYWRIEKGKANVTIKTLMKLLDVHNMTIQQFFCSLRDSKPASSRSVLYGL